MNTCDTCRHWQRCDAKSEAHWMREDCRQCFTFSEETYKHEPFVGLEVRRCISPKLLVMKRPEIETEASVIDGENYYAALHTGAKFGCVNWEAIEQGRDGAK
jgi:hypothetical protein